MICRCLCPEAVAVGCAGQQVQVQVPANGQPGMTIQFQV